MEMTIKATNPPSDGSQIIPRSDENVEAQNVAEVLEEDGIVHDYSERGQWLRAAVLGANDGLLSTASLMMGVGAVRQDYKTMVITGTAGLVAGACSMAIGEFVSVYSQYDIELAQVKRERKRLGGAECCRDARQLEELKKRLPNPFHAAAASALSFAVGALVPLLSAAFVGNYHVRLAVIVAAVSMALVGFGGFAAVLGKSSPVKGPVRILVGGWLAMGITFWLTKVVGSINI